MFIKMFIKSIFFLILLIPFQSFANGADSSERPRLSSCSTLLSEAEGQQRPTPQLSIVSKEFAQLYPELRPRTLHDFGLQQYAVHNMKDSYFQVLLNHIRQSGMIDQEWPWKGYYPGVWLAIWPPSFGLKTIDGTLGVTYPDDQRAAVLKLKLSATARVLVLQGFDFTPEEKQILRQSKIKESTSRDKWEGWLHLRKESIRLAAEAGYDLLRFGEVEYVLLNVECVEGIAYWNDRGDRAPSWATIF